MNKRHYEHTLPNIRGSLSNTYKGAGYMLHEPLHPLREPFRVIVHAEQPVRFRCQVHV